MVIVFMASLLSTKNYKLLSGKKIMGNKVALTLIFISFSFIMGARSFNVGVDTLPYTRIYTAIANSKTYLIALKNAQLTAPIYVLFCWVISIFSSDPRLLILISAIVVNLALVSFIKKTSRDVSTSAFIWIGLALFYCSMNGNRQCISLTIALNAIYYLVDDIKSKKGWFLFLISIGIHTTAIFFGLAIVGIILVDYLKDSKLIFIISTTTSILLSFGYSALVKLYVRLFPRYSIYTSGDSIYSILSGTGEGRIIILYIFLFCVIILWLFKNTKMENTEDSFNLHVLPAVVFGTIFGIINCRNELINRLLWYYLALFISFIPSTISKFRQSDQIVIKWIIIIILNIYSIISLLENKNGVIPYSFFWSQ